MTAAQRIGALSRRAAFWNDAAGRMASAPRDTPLLWPTLGTIVFVLIVPGTVVVGVPHLLSRWTLQPPFFGLASTRWIGALLWIGGLPLFLDFLWRFVSQGRGTPAPVAPPRHLVVTGAYRYTRNPGYIAVIALLLGQALFFGSAAVLLYTLLVAAAFQTFVVWYEEPTLRRQFGAEYEDYCRQVPRWWPHLTNSETATRRSVQ